MSSQDLNQLQIYLQERFDEVLKLIKMSLANNLIDDLRKDLVELPFEDSDSLYLQIGDNEWKLSDWRSRAVEAFLSDGHKNSLVEKVSVYLKPEDGKAYYVINGNMQGSFEL